MHFGLVAFDLFVEMYRQELANAGKPGWPEKLPLDAEEQIPAAIVAHNLHGIDIDLRAVQLSALTLYLKAKTLNPKAMLKESRLACADIHMLDGSRLQEFLAQAGLTNVPSTAMFWRLCRIVSKMPNNSGRCCAWTKKFGRLWSRSVCATNGRDASSTSPDGHRNNSKRKLADVNSGNSWKFRSVRPLMRSHGSEPSMAKISRFLRARPQKGFSSWRSCPDGTTRS